MRQRMGVRVALGVATTAAAMVTVAGVAAAQPQAPSTVVGSGVVQADLVGCSWGGDGPLATRQCDSRGGGGSAAMLGEALGQMIGRALFQPGQ